MLCMFELPDAHLPLVIHHNCAKVIVKIEVVGSTEQCHKVGSLSRRGKPSISNITLGQVPLEKNT